MTLRCVIVDDEPLARRRLRAMLAVQADVEVVAEAEDAVAARRAIAESRPDVVFLDVEMPGGDGFDVLETARAAGAKWAPFVVFVTAFANHAVRAFDADAVDYLLKPYDDARLMRSLARAREAVAARGVPALASEVRTLLDALKRDASSPRATSASRDSWLRRIAVTVGTRTVFAKLEDVDWIEASDNYVCLHAGGKHYVVRTTLAALEAQLDPSAFVRVHRSAIVQIDRVREIRTTAQGDARAVMADGKEVAISARYRERLRGR